MNFFFYGTLRSRFFNSQRWLPGLSPVAEARTVGRYRLYIQNGQIPCAVPDPRGYRLVGELWTLDEASAQIVHRLETGYQAEMIPVVTKPGRLERALIYYCSQAFTSPYAGPYDREEFSGDYANAVAS